MRPLQSRWFSNHISSVSIFVIFGELVGFACWQQCKSLKSFAKEKSQCLFTRWERKPHIFSGQVEWREGGTQRAHTKGSVLLNLLQRNFFQWMIISTGTHSWTMERERDTVFHEMSLSNTPRKVQGSVQTWAQNNCKN